MIIMALLIVPILINSANATIVYYVENNTEQTTTSNTFVNATTLNFTVNTNGSYILLTTADIHNSASNSQTEMQLLMNSEILGKTSIEPHNIAEAYDYQAFSVIKTVELTEGTDYLFELQYRDVLLGTAYTKNNRIALFELVNVWHEEQPNNTPLNIGSYANVLTQIVTANHTGGYLIMVNAETNSTTSESSCVKAILNGTTIGETCREAKDNTDYDSFSFFVVEGYGQNQTINLTIQAYGEGTGSYIRNLKTSIIRSTLESYYAENNTETSTSSTIDIEYLNLTDKPTAEGDYLIGAVAEYRADATNRKTTVKLYIDGVEICNQVTQPTEISSPTDWYSFSCIKAGLFTYTTHTANITYSVDSAVGNAYIRNARIFAVRFETETPTLLSTSYYQPSTTAFTPQTIYANYTELDYTPIDSALVVWECGCTEENKILIYNVTSKLYEGIITNVTSGYHEWSVDASINGYEPRTSNNNFTLTNVPTNLTSDYEINDNPLINGVLFKANYTSLEVNESQPILDATVIVEINSENHTLEYNETTTLYEHLVNLSGGNYNFTVYANRTNFEPNNYTDNISVPYSTSLNAIYDYFILLNSSNTIQANYTLLSNYMVLLNATCYFNSTEGNETMLYNATTETYEVILIPSLIGQINFTINCSKTDYSTQFTEQIITSNIFGVTPFDYEIHLWTDLNATTPYIDEFAFILLATNDLNCSSYTGFDYCVFNARYKSGQSNYTLYLGANYTMFYYSGELSFETELSPPSFHSFNDLVWLGNYIIEQGDERLDIYVNDWEIDFWRGVKGFMLTWGILIGAFILALLMAVGSYLLIGKKSLSVLIFILILYGIFLLWNTGVLGLPEFPALDGFSSIF